MVQIQCFEWIVFLFFFWWGNKKKKELNIREQQGQNLCRNDNSSSIWTSIDAANHEWQAWLHANVREVTCRRSTIASRSATVVRRPRNFWHRFCRGSRRGTDLCTPNYIASKVLKRRLKGSVDNYARKMEILEILEIIIHNSDMCVCVFRYDKFFKEKTFSSSLSL